MEPLYPLVFQPRFKERVWGGRRLEALYGKRLPPDVPIGESWEIADRPGDESVIANGPLAGRTLRALMNERAAEVLGTARPTAEGRFPLLCKILDARDRLSLQVHPPERAAHLGEPKTEMWYIAAADPGAELFVGLKAGVSRAHFEQAIDSGEVRDAFKVAGVKTFAGDWTNGDPEITHFLEGQGRAGVPLYLWYAPGKARPEELPQVITPAMLISRARAPQR